MSIRSACAMIVPGPPTAERTDGSCTDPMILDYFRCPARFASVEAQPRLSAEAGYFSFRGATCFGRLAVGSPAQSVSGDLADVAGAAMFRAGTLHLPFDLDEVVTNLRQERYQQTRAGWLETSLSNSVTRAAYYKLRPFLSVGIRKHLQRLRLRNWDRITFPVWPIDDSVDRLLRGTMAMLLRASGVSEIPFIWFWPEGAPGCVMMTHDVEGSRGRQYWRRLAAIDQSFRIPSAFQMIPGDPLGVEVVQELRKRGFEVNLHDLEHDGALFEDYSEFQTRAAAINWFARKFGCRGFRAGAMYREQSWFKDLDFEYDMSVPNAAHLEPQRGGCCTVMPYFNGTIVELPLTTTQDYSLFHILGEYSVHRWQQQIDMLLARSGLISFIAHPDYLAEPRAESVYIQLLEHLSRLRTERNVWVALPGDVNDWWRARQEMTMVHTGGTWAIVGPGSERARVAYAALDGDDLVYRFAEDGKRAEHRTLSVRQLR